VSSPPPSPEDGNRSGFRKIVFFGIPDDGKVQKNSVNSGNFTVALNEWMIVNNELERMWKEVFMVWLSSPLLEFVWRA
jgi:hypothetical protein